METLLIHRDLLHSDLFNSIAEMLEHENVRLYSGPTLNRAIKFAPPLTKELKHEYSDLQLTVELVDNVDAAIQHVNKYGSNHTDTIVTKNGILFIVIKIIVIRQIIVVF